MPADVVHHANHAIAAAYRNHRQARKIGDDMVAGGAQLRDMRRPLPGAIKQRTPVKIGHRGVHIKPVSYTHLDVYKRQVHILRTNVLDWSADKL